MVVLGEDLMSNFWLVWPDRPFERGVAAGEHQPQAVVAHGSVLVGFVRGTQKLRLGVLVRADRFAAQLVDRPVAGSGDDPAGRTGRHAIGRPAFESGRERIGDSVLGRVDVTEPAHEYGDSSAVLGAEHSR